MSASRETERGATALTVVTSADEPLSLWHLFAGIRAAMAALADGEITLTAARSLAFRVEDRIAAEIDRLSAVSSAPAGRTPE